MGLVPLPQADAQQRKFDEFVRKLEADFAAADVQVFAAAPHGATPVEYPTEYRESTPVEGGCAGCSRGHRLRRQQATRQAERRRPRLAAYAWGSF